MQQARLPPLLHFLHVLPILLCRGIHLAGEMLLHRLKCLLVPVSVLLLLLSELLVDVD